MKKIMPLAFLTAILAASQGALAAQDLNIPEPPGRRLRQIVAEKFPDGQVIIGGTTGSWAFGRATGLIMDREFSYVTPENDFKQAVIHPDPNTWNWKRAEAWLRHVTDNNQVLRIHGPISPQCSHWAKQDQRIPRELRDLLREFMTALCQRYNGKPGFRYLDVVNETTNNNRWHTNKPGTGWEVPWYLIGQDTDKNRTPLYIKMAFEIAKQYAPDLKLIYNHHEDMKREGSWRLIKETIGYLRQAGLRVDGIGWQAHVDNGWATPENLNKLRDLIDWAQRERLEFHVTEASVWLKNGVTAQALALQAETYSAIVKVLLEKSSNGRVGWNTWHIDDPHGWKREWHGALFDDSYTAKPAYYALQKVLEQRN